MTRDAAIDRAMAFFDDGRFLDLLGRRVQIPTESQNPKRLPELRAYLEREIAPALEQMGHSCRILDNPVAGAGPVLAAERIEDPALPTVLGYGHGDVILGYEGQWAKGRDPWRIERDGDRLYGRGTADNKGQHAVNIVAMAMVLETRGKLGFNPRWMIEMGEENGSAGLAQLVAANKPLFAADVFIASDGPRISVDRPTISLGCRGAMNFDIVCELREGGHHSGNWGGLLANPGVILAHALASIIGRDGHVKVRGLMPPPMSNSVRDALKDITVDAGPDGPKVDANWGERGLSPAERVFGWNTFEVLAYETGNAKNPVNAIPPRARAHCQIRFVAGSREEEFLPAIRQHLDEHGFPEVQILPPPPENAAGYTATRTDPDHPWARWTARAIERTTGKRTAVVPSLGGSICNEIFTDILGLPAIWIPHSYSGCSQHAPDEHILLPEFREALAIMTGLYWDLGEPGTPGR